jgi:hypothetical protein
MKDQIERMETLLREMKSEHEKEEKLNYESKPHKHFNKGDMVAKGTDVGIVEWVENGDNCPLEAGYMGVNRISGEMGFMAYQRRDDWDIVNDPYYRDRHTLTVELTGIEIERLKHDLVGRNCNPSSPKEKIFDAIDALIAELNKEK